MLLEVANEVEIFGVYDRGIANKERIVLRIRSLVNLGSYCMILGLRQPDGMIVPLTDHFLWFGEWVMQGPGWVFVHTGPGQSGESKENATNEPAYNLYWGKKQVILTIPEVIPAILRLDGIFLGHKGESKLVELPEWDSVLALAHKASE